MGTSKIIADSGKATVIVWFHPDCEHCIYQLDIINYNLSLFNETKFYFLTDEIIFPQKRHLGKWTTLTSANNVQFGIIRLDIFKKYFGSVVKPSTFIFDQRGKLINKILGEVKIQKLLELTNTILVPEQKAVLNNTSDRGYYVN
jgi:hypothetical protein